MIVFNAEQVRSSFCPINSDNCIGCKYFYGTYLHGGATVNICCSYEESNDFFKDLTDNITPV